ncbi:hypothetical protein V6N13_064177 [Hibiscus sabdariffa]
MICFSCGIYGHNPEICPAQKPPCNETDAYGPWMVVERRQRCTPVKQVPPKVNHATSNVVASRFNPISDENLSEHTTDTDVPPRSHASVVAAKAQMLVALGLFSLLTVHHHSAVVIPDNDDSSPPINVSSPDVIKCATRHDSMEQDKENHSLPPMMSEFYMGGGSAHARLDQFLCKTYWDEAFPESSVSHLLHMRSGQSAYASSGWLSSFRFDKGPVSVFHGLGTFMMISDV